MIHRPARVVGLALDLARLAFLSAVVCCAGIGPDPPEKGRLHPQLRELWADYSSLPSTRALAVAGELRRNQWVAGASGGHDTRTAAKRAAIAECKRRRAKLNLVAPCRIYAVDNEVVWAERQRSGSAGRYRVVSADGGGARPTRSLGPSGR